MKAELHILEELKSEEFLVCGKPDISKAEEKAVLRVLRSGWLGNGEECLSLETSFMGYLWQEGAPAMPHAIAVNSCTMGLMLCLRAAGIGQGDEVITTPLTFAATVNAIIHVGATPVFADVNETGCIDTNDLRRYVTDKTRAILPVHLHGSPCDMNPIMGLAKEIRVPVIEDAAHGFGGTYEGMPLGTIGHYGVFSFYPTKNIASADGGMIVTGAGDRADEIRVMASQGLSSGAWKRYGSGPIKNYQVETAGYKGLMTDLNAALVKVQLERWPNLQEKRSTIWKVYEKAFGKEKEGHSQHLYTLRVKNRDKFREKLYELGIGTGVHYAPLHLEPAYRFLKYKKGDFPMAEKIGSETVSLPLSPTMTEEDALRVVKAVNIVLREK